MKNDAFAMMAKQFMFGGQYRMSQNELKQAFDQNYKFYKKNQKDQEFYITKSTVIDRKQKITLAKLHQLKPIQIKQLKVGSVHQGKYIRLKFIKDCYKVEAIHGLVQDQSKRICALAIYNYPLNKKRYYDIFKKDLEIYVKQPYYKSSVGGYLNIRVDDPSDIEFEKDVKIFETNQNDKKSSKSLQCKELGNKYYAENNFIDALIEYNKAIQFEDDQQKLSILWSNKALSLLGLRCGNQALNAAETSLKLNSGNLKAAFRKVSALILLNQFEKSEDQIYMLQDRLPENEIKKLNQKLKIKQEYFQGKFTWQTIFDSYDPEQYQNPKISIKKSQTQKHLAVFAVDQIKPYEILLIEKPIFSEKNKYKGEREHGDFILQSNYDKKHLQLNRHNIFLRSQLEKIYKNTCDAKMKIKALWDIKTQNFSLEERQKQEISADILNEKIDENCYILCDYKQFINCQPVEIRGVWQKLSLFNYRCEPNAHIISLNDNAVVISSKVIKKGQQIFLQKFTFLAETKGKRHTACKQCQYCKDQLRFVSFEKEQKKIAHKKQQLIELINSFKDNYWKTEAILYLINSSEQKLPKQYYELFIKQSNVCHYAVMGNLVHNHYFQGIVGMMVKISQKFFGSWRAVKSLIHPEIYQSVEMERLGYIKIY